MPKAKTKPRSISINGQRYDSTLLKVIDRDPDGSARRFELLRDDESANLAGGEQFWIVYALPAMQKRRS